MNDITPTKAVERMEEALRELREAARDAALALRAEARVLQQCSTVDGVWDGSEPAAQASYERLMALAQRLEGGL